MAEVTVWEEFLKSIPAIAILLLLVWAGVRIWDATHPEQYSTERKDLMRISAEIQDLRCQSGGVCDSITVPVFSTGWTIDAFNTNTNPELRKTHPGCNNDYCVCFKKGSAVSCETFNLRDQSYKMCQYNGNAYKGVGLTSTATTDKSINIRRDNCNIAISQ